VGPYTPSKKLFKKRRNSEIPEPIKKLKAKILKKEDSFDRCDDDTVVNLKPFMAHTKKNFNNVTLDTSPFEDIRSKSQLRK